MQVDLTCGSRNVQMQISDNGRGIADADRLKAKSFGIRGMVERASALGGTLTIAAGANGGSVVLVRVPLRSDALAPPEAHSRSLAREVDSDSPGHAHASLQATAGAAPKATR